MTSGGRLHDTASFLAMMSCCCWLTHPARTMRMNRNGSRTCCMERRLAQQRPNGASLAWTITLNNRTRSSCWTLRGATIGKINGSVVLAIYLFGGKIGSS